MQRFKTATVATVAFLLLVAGCGGDSDGAGGDDGAEGSGTNQATTTQAVPEDAGSNETAAPTTTEMDDNGDDSEGAGPSTATVTLGGETYNFSTEGAIVAQCLTNLFGIFSVQLPMVDESGAQADGSVAIVGLHADTNPEVVGEVNAIEVAIGDDDWVADEADMLFEMSDVLEPGMSQVDAIEIDGRTVRGTATFVRQNSVFAGEVETLTGTFEATCGEERTS